MDGFWNGNLITNNIVIRFSLPRLNRWFKHYFFFGTYRIHIFQVNPHKFFVSSHFVTFYRWSHSQCNYSKSRKKFRKFSILTVKQCLSTRTQWHRAACTLTRQFTSLLITKILISTLPFFNFIFFWIKGKPLMQPFFLKWLYWRLNSV